MPKTTLATTLSHLAVLCLCALCQSTLAQRGGMVRNGTFSEGSKGWRLDRLSAVADVDGSKVLAIDDTGKKVGSDIYSDPIPVESDRQYTLTARIKYEGSRTGLIYIRDHKGAKQIARQRHVLGIGDRSPGKWHTVSTSFRPHPAADNVRLWIHSSGGAVGRYCFDDIQLFPAKEIDVTAFFKDAAKEHPRIYLSDRRLAQIRQNIKSDPNARKASEVIIKHANALLEAKPIAYVKTGRRMLAPAGETVSRIKYLGMAYHLTGEKKYAEGGVAVLLAATKIPHWNPSHYLDTAGLCLATGLGYDWFYDQLTPAQRETVVKAIVDKGIETSFGGRPWWANGKSNWNQVCNSGLGIAALAIWEDEPQVAAQTIKRSLKGIPHTMDTYAPDGIYFEGPSYWSYGTSYTVQFIDALENVMGTDFGLSKFPGFMESVDAINFITGPTGLFLNFSDGYRYRYTQAATYWFADRRQDPNLLFIENGYMARSLQKKPGSGHYPDMVMYLVWSDQAQTAKAPKQRHWHGKGLQPLASFRSSWDKDATFAAMKGGVSGGGHQHMDVGGFVIDADGVRWASDTASQSYDLEANAHAKAKAEGRPFEPAFYRDRWSHNILVVDGQKPVPGSKSPMLAFSDKPENPHVIFDLSPAYKGQLAQAKRGLRLYREKSVVVQDEFTTLGKEETQIRWAMLTRNSAEVSNASVSDDGKRLVLRRSGKGSPTMEMRILSPTDARFEVLVTNDQPYIHDYDRMSDSDRQVVINLRIPADATQTLTVCFRPGSVLADEPQPTVTSLSEWQE
jgi:hypothetical protein